jgi:hypothetical protein
MLEEDAVAMRLTSVLDTEPRSALIGEIALWTPVKAGPDAGSR